MRETDRRILRLAVPALGALVAEPLFLLTDTAMVGHLGVDPLAGLGIASTILQTAIGLLVFLAYSTTPAVARRLGAGDTPGAVRAGIDGLWLALLLGLVLVTAGVPSASSLVGLFGAGEAASTAAATYLGISVWGIPSMLVFIAATGLFRGLQDTRTPLVISVAGFGANILLNAALIYGAGLGIAGAALGTVIAQTGMAAASVAVAVRAARRVGTGIRPRLEGFRSMAGPSGWMLLRTLWLRAAMVLTMAVATGLGTVATASLHIVLGLFGLLALILDALAIAAQALIGHDLGRTDAAARGHVREVTTRLSRLGVIVGGVLALPLAALAGVLPWLFSSDGTVHAATWPMIVLLAVQLPLAGYVFALDGVLIGAGDGRYLALAGLVTLVVYVPLAVGAGLVPGALGAAALWAAFGFGYLGARAVTLGLRVREDGWMR